MGRNSGETSNAVLTVRLIVGAYLFYIDYQLFDEVMEKEGTDRIVMIAFMIFFAIAGAVLIVMSARALLGGGSKDTGAEAADGKDGERTEGESGPAGDDGGDDTEA